MRWARKRLFCSAPETKTIPRLTTRPLWKSFDLASFPASPVQKISVCNLQRRNAWSCWRHRRSLPPLTNEERMEINFSQEVDAALNALRKGDVILYPTDTIWGLGCDTNNEDAIKKIYRIKNRSESKSLIVLVADERAILHHVAAPD